MACDGPLTSHSLRYGVDVSLSLASFLAFFPLYFTICLFPCRFSNLSHFLGFFLFHAFFSLPFFLLFLLSPFSLFSSVSLLSVFSPTSLCLLLSILSLPRPFCSSSPSLPFPLLHIYLPLSFPFLLPLSRTANRSGRKVLVTAIYMCSINFRRLPREWGIDVLSSLFKIRGDGARGERKMLRTGIGIMIIWIFCSMNYSWFRGHKWNLSMLHGN